jgi:flagellar basal body-associated protein FliL
MSYLDSVMQGSNGDVRSTAMAWIYFIIVMVILAAVAGLLSMFVFYQRKD